MSDDDVNQLTPDDGDVDEVVVARLRSALLDAVEVTDQARDQAVNAVMAQLGNDLPSSGVTELSLRRRGDMNNWLQAAAAVAVIAVGAGVLLQLQTGGDDSLELSVKQATVERSEGDYSLADEESSTDDASDSAAGALLEAEPTRELFAFQESMESDLESAVEGDADADVAVAASEIPSIHIDDLPTFIDELVAQQRSSLPINNVCAIGEDELVELLAEVVIDGMRVSLIRNLATNTYIAVDLSTCEVLADVELGGQ